MANGIYSKDNLRRCPFCNGKALWEHNFSIYCEDCKSSTPTYQIWNQRKNELDEEIKAMSLAKIGELA